jgi:hypothetical protein
MLEIIHADSPEQIADARALFEEYAASRGPIPGTAFLELRLDEAPG